ncbi:MAG TPA: LytTR family DNA-binding domain-containing protein [Candidatus Dormibacteraeota bacterium]|nr:LytTR family DNA-binding domain-containing protein [Candidatus Dormibacteraeota bacterium]
MSAHRTAANCAPASQAAAYQGAAAPAPAAPHQERALGLRALIVEDEAAAGERLRLLCRREGDIEVLECATNAQQAIASLTTLKPSLLFLDVRVRGCETVDVLGAVAAAPLPLIVFTSAYRDYALTAFEHAAVDYLLKPYSDERFRLAARRARLRAWELGACHPAAAYPRILAERQQRLYFLDPTEIESVAAEGNYVSLQVRGASYLARVSLHRLEVQLAPNSFVRVHRSLMLNLDHVDYMERGLRGAFRITLRSGARVHSSPRFRAQILARAQLR